MWSYSYCIRLVFFKTSDVFMCLVHFGATGRYWERSSEIRVQACTLVWYGHQRSRKMYLCLEVDSTMIFRSTHLKTRHVLGEPLRPPSVLNFGSNPWPFDIKGPGEWIEDSHLQGSRYFTLLLSCRSRIPTLQSYFVKVTPRPTVCLPDVTGETVIVAPESWCPSFRVFKMIWVFGINIRVD